MIKVLLAITDDKRRKAMAEYFSKFFNICATCGTSDEVLISYEKEMPDVVLFDIHLKPLNGYGLLKELITRYPMVKGMGMSVFSNNMVAERLLAMGCWGYCSTETEYDDIVSAIKRICEQGKAFIH